MKKVFLLGMFIFLSFFTTCNAKEIDSLQPASQIPSSQLENLSEYFASYSFEENDEVYNRIYGKSFPTDGSLSLDTLRYLKMIYYNYQNQIVVGEMIVHSSIQNDVLHVFQKLFQEGIQIYSMKLIDDYWPTNGSSEDADNVSMAANNTSAFNYRPITNGTNLSKHALGMAIDVNPRENPYVNGDIIKPSSSSSYVTNRDYLSNPHVITKNSRIYEIFKEAGFTWGGDWTSPKDYQHFEKSGETEVTNTNTNVKTVLLIAAHGLGGGDAHCNHASGTIGGTTYYENIESRKAIDRIAYYLEQAGIKYEIANQIVGDSWWASNEQERLASRNCNPESSSNCCGFKSPTLGNNAPILFNYIDSVGPQNYSVALELHFNASRGSYSTTILKTDNYTTEMRDNALRFSHAVADTIGYGTAQFHTDLAIVGMNLATLRQLYVNRSIPTYYMEAVFMDNPTQFEAYLNHADEVAKSIADVIIDIAPQSLGGSGGSSGSQGGSSSTGYNPGSPGRYVDPYPNVFGKVDLSVYEEKIGCNTLLFDSQQNPTEFKKFLDDLFHVLQILTPIIVIILCTIDYIKGISSADADFIKKANVKTVKRIAIGLMIFLLPYFLDLLFHLFGLYDLSSCGIGG